MAIFISILVLLNNLFKRKLGKQRGGGSLTTLIGELSSILTPQGLSAFLASVGLVVVATTNKKTVGKVVKKAKKAVKRVTKNAKKTVKKAEKTVKRTTRKIKKTVKKL